MKIIYLVQSDNHELRYKFPKGSSYLLLQWQDIYIPAHNSFHFPKSSWAAGRNELLKRAMEIDDYDYYVFLDDDLKITFNFKHFEQQLTLLKGKRIIPNLPNHFWNQFSLSLYDSVKYCDHAFMALPKEMISKTNLYSLIYDQINWWYASEKCCEELWDKYPQQTIRINTMSYYNLQHRSYPKSNYKGFPQNQVQSYVC